MEFLKSLFEGGSLTYDQLLAKANDAKMNVVNLADGNYVSKAKYDNKVEGLTQQVTDLQGQISQRDTDMAGLQSQLTAAQSDASQLTAAQQALTDLQSRYDTERQQSAAKLAQQQYEFMIRERAGALDFSSASAKRAFIGEALQKGFKVDGDTLQGYDEFVTKYKADDPGAFAQPKQPDPAGEPKPDLVLPSGKKPDPSTGFNFHFNGVRPIPKE